MNCIAVCKTSIPALLLGLTICTPAVAVVPYTVIDLGEIESPFNEGAGTTPGNPGNSINNRGEVVGTTNDQPFLYSGGQMINIETFANPQLPPDLRLGSANGINDSGHVVGSRHSDIDPELGFPNTTAFLYNGQQVTNLGTLNPNEHSAAHSINNHGQIVGYSGRDAFFYSNGTMIDIGKLPGHSDARAVGINDQGTIIGSSSNSSSASSYAPVKGFIYQNGTLSELSPLLGDTASSALSINEAGMVAGVSFTAGGYLGNGSNFSAVLWNNGVATDLGTLSGHTDSFARGINNLGDIVGESWGSAPGDGRPFLYRGGQMYDLLSLIQPGPYDIINAYGINDLGQILAYGGNAAGEARVFLLTPVPEPETYALMLSGLLMLLIRSKRKLQQSQWVHRLLQMAGRSYAIHSFA